MLSAGQMEALGDLAVMEEEDSGGPGHLWAQEPGQVWFGGQ